MTEELKKKRNAAAARMTDLADRIAREKRDFTAEESRDWDACNADYDAARRQIETERRASEIRREQERRVGDPDVGREDGRGRHRGDNVVRTEEKRVLAFRAWARTQMGETITEQQEAACRELRFNPNAREMRIGLWDDERRNRLLDEVRETHHKRRGAVIRREARAGMSAFVGPSGGYLTAPARMSDAYELNLLAFGGIRQVATIVTTDTGEPYITPTVDDTTNKGQRVGENQQVITGSTNPAIGRVKHDAYTYSSKPVLIPSTLLRDDRYDLAGQLGEMLATRIARITAEEHVTGTGNGMPQGILNGATLGKTTAGAAAIIFDELVDLEHSVDPSYRTQPGVGWMFHDKVRAYLRKIKDTTGKPLWTNGELWNSGLVDGGPERLLGYPIQICQEMPSTVTTGLKTIVFGLLPKYVIRTVNDVRFYRLQERYRDYDQDGFVCFQNEDGKLVDAGTAPVKYLQQA